MQFLLILILLGASYFILPQLQREIKLMEGSHEQDIEKAFTQEKDKQKKNILFYFKQLKFRFIVFLLTIILCIVYILI